MTKAEADKAIGLKAVAATGKYDPENAFNYDDGEGYGLYVLYNKAMKVYSKTALYKDAATDFAPFTIKPVTEDQCDKITDGMSHADVIKLLGGDGVERSSTATKQDTITDVGTIFYWGNSDGSFIQIPFLSNNTARNAMFFDAR